MANKNNAKFVFYYLLSLTALIFMAISVGLIAYGIINELIADPLLANGYYDSFHSQFKFAISAIIISTPLFYLSTGLIRKGIIKGELESESPLRRWLTYFILLVSSLVILGLLISIINSFLGGELTLRFILKALTVFIISALTFAYYFYDIQTEKVEKGDKWVKIFFWSSLVLVLIAFVSVWFFIESPREARAKSVDQVTMNKILSLENDINFYYSNNKELPANLAAVASGSNLDTLKEKGIEYKKIDSQNFEICATFLTDSENLDDSYHYASRGYDRDYQAGYSCLPGNLWQDIDEEKMAPTLSF